MRLLNGFLLFAAVLLCTECSEYDDSDILERLDKLEGRVSALERDAAATNSEITALQALVNAVSGNDYITGVRAIVEDGQAGLEITYSKSGTVKVFLNRDSLAPMIGVKDVGGVLYWTVNGELMQDSSGKWIQAAGKDGTSGANGVTPKLKIEGGYWYVSYDGEKTWTKLSAATAGTTGIIFRSVEVVDSLLSMLAALTSPSWEFSRSIIPLASILMSSFGTLFPPFREVVPWSPVFVYMSFIVRIFQKCLCIPSTGACSW